MSIPNPESRLPAPGLRGLYAVTPASLCREPARLYTAVEAVLSGGAVLLQYRDKLNDASTRRHIAGELQRLCAHAGVPLVINDDLDLAAELGTGVHLGLNDAPLAEARRRLPGDAVIGVTCGDSLSRAQTAEHGGAGYAGFGRFFASRTKPDAPSAPLVRLTEARRQLSLPICAIGGITPDNAAAVIGAGADLVAAVEGVFGADDVESAARAISRLFGD
jgi:thiamine-phosphate pyrophosphorylase